MQSNFELFKNLLDEAVDLIEQTPLVELTNLKLLQPQVDMLDTQSLLARCESICSKYEHKKPTIRIIHHFACSGGTSISKCISAMPNVFLLSEVHPHSDLQNNKGKLEYSPSDIAKLLIYAGVPKQKELAGKIFINSVDTVYQHINEQGGTLILRDHSHSDFCVGQEVDNHTVINLLKKDFKVVSLVTLRNPIDSYLSLVANGWIHFQPSTFDEYCKRLLSFLAPFSQDEIIFYEDFVQQPQQVVEQMCSKLLIPFDDTFEAVFDIFSVTGDSGRKGALIQERKRRDMNENILLEIKSSTSFKKIVSQFPEYRLN